MSSHLSPYPSWPCTVGQQNSPRGPWHISLGGKGKEDVKCFRGLRDNLGTLHRHRVSRRSVGHLDLTGRGFRKDLTFYYCEMRSRKFPGSVEHDSPARTESNPLQSEEDGLDSRRALGKERGPSPTHNVGVWGLTHRHGWCYPAGPLGLKQAPVGNTA